MCAAGVCVPEASCGTVVHSYYQRVGAHAIDAPIESVAIRGSVVFTNKTQTAVSVVDFSTPGSPQEIATIDRGTTVYSVNAMADRLYVAGNEGLLIFDVSVPSSPSLIGSYVDSYVQRVAVSADTAYGLAGEMVIVIDISDETAPVEVGRRRVRDARDLAVDGSIVYVAKATGVQALNASDPQFLVLGGVNDSVRNLGQAGNLDARVRVAGHTLVHKHRNVLALYDLTDPMAPVMVGYERDNFGPSGISDVFVVDDVAYVAHSRHVTAFDLSHPSSPALFNRFGNGSGWARGIASNGAHAFLSRSHNDVGPQTGEIQAINVTARADSPQRVAAYDTPGNSVALQLVGDVAYIADGMAGLHMVDISEPLQPVEIGTWTLPGALMGLTIVEDKAYLAAGDSLHIVDVTDPTAPVPLGSVSGLGATYDVAVEGTVAVVTDQTMGAHVVDIADPVAPVVTGTVPFASTPYRIAMGDGFAYVASFSGVVVLDVRSASSPQWVTTLGLFDSPVADVMRVGDALYASLVYGGLARIDVSQPLVPEVGQMKPGFFDVYLDGMTLAGNYISRATSRPSRTKRRPFAWV